jgi:hypothetical protein
VLIVLLDNSINQQHQIQNPRQDESEPVRTSGASPAIDARAEHSSTHRIRNSLSERGHEAKDKLKKVLHISKDNDDPVKESPIQAGPLNGDNDNSILSKVPVPTKQGMKDFAHHPVDTVQAAISNQGNQQVAANIASKEVPHEQEKELVEAKERLDDAQTEKERLLAIKDINRLLRERQTWFIRWTLDRHVAKVRLLPKDDFPSKPLSSFRKTTSQGDVVTDWEAYLHHQLLRYAQLYGGQYIGYGSNPPPPSKQAIIPNLERVLVASAPLQEFAMATRRVYRWENPRETTKYLVVYAILWYFNLLLPGTLSVIVYLVIMRHVHGDTLENLRDEIRRTEDVRQTARSLTEFIQKEGEEEWANRILELIGEWLMIQLADLANTIESARNFYEWRIPHRTKITLGMFVVAILVTTFTPLWLLVKSATFGAGVTFFGLFPLAVNYPDYRLLLSPTKRIFWNIPTHAEWAVQAIQAEGSRFDEKREAQTPASSLLGQSPKTIGQDDYGVYTAHYNGDRGKVVIGKCT